MKPFGPRTTFLRACPFERCLDSVASIFFKHPDLRPVQKGFRIVIAQVKWATFILPFAATRLWIKPLASDGFGSAQLKPWLETKLVKHRKLHLEPIE
jgi:hypothetical protein